MLAGGVTIVSFDPEPNRPPPSAPTSLWRRVLAWRPWRSRPSVLAVRMPRSRWGWALLAFVSLPVVYFVGGALWIHQISDEADFAPRGVAPGESQLVAAIAALITREVDDHSWTPMHPWFLPSGLLDNMPNFQTGIVKASARVTVELRDQLGRTRASSVLDKDLDAAASRLNAAPNVWFIESSVSWLPTTPSSKQYRAGRDSLVAYNKRVGAGQAMFERRSDTLQALLQRMANDIGAASAQIDQHLTGHGGALIDWHADNIFYANKGELYAYYIMLKAITADFQALLQERGVTQPWQRMIDTFRTAATMQPWVVINGRPDSQFLPSHLASQGFYLLRARTQLREIIDILQR